MNENKLLQIATEDGLYLHGYYIPSENKKVAILHIHGFEGNFYENNFVHVLADTLEKEAIGFLTVNTRGNGKDTDFNTTSGDYKSIGAHYEVLEEAHLDISAWIEFLIKEGYEQIILQGHSLGTVKSVRYLFEGKYKDKISKLILLAPFDRKGLMDVSNRNISSLAQKAQKLIENGKGNKLVTQEFDDIVLSYNTFVSWYKQDDYGKMFEFCNPKYDFPLLKQIKIPTKIIVGSIDEYFHPTNPDHPEEAMKILLDNIPQAEGEIIENAPHSFSPYEQKMAAEVIKFAKQYK